MSFKCHSYDPDPQRIASLGRIMRKMLAQSHVNHNRPFKMQYYRILASKKEMNNGFVMLYDYTSWPAGTLKHRGYLNPKNREFWRPMHEHEKETSINSHRLKSLRYETWEELEIDERLAGTNEETILKMRDALAPEIKIELELKVLFGDNR